MIGLVIIQRNVAFFPIPSMVLGLLDQLHIFWQFHLIELPGLLTGLGLLELQNLIDSSKAFYRVLQAVLIHKLKSYGISGQVCDLISSFLSNRWLWVVLNGRSSPEYPVNDGVLKAPFLVLHFCYYTLVTFLMMLSEVLLSMLMILLSTLNVIRHLICGNNQSCLLKMNLINETLWTEVGSGLLISMLEQLSWFHLIGLITLVLLM